MAVTRPVSAPKTATVTPAPTPKMATNMPVSDHKIAAPMPEPLSRRAIRRKRFASKTAVSAPTPKMATVLPAPVFKRATTVSAPAVERATVLTTPVPQRAVTIPAPVVKIAAIPASQPLPEMAASPISPAPAKPQLLVSSLLDPQITSARVSKSRNLVLSSSVIPRATEEIQHSHKPESPEHLLTAGRFEPGSLTMHDFQARNTSSTALDCDADQFAELLCGTTLVSSPALVTGSACGTTLVSSPALVAGSACGTTLVSSPVLVAGSACSTTLVSSPALVAGAACCTALDLLHVIIRTLIPTFHCTTNSNPRCLRQSGTVKYKTNLNT
ncbi:hypothetical protein Q7C36_016571 [Tachysurus vachellii]|uniref:Uncharacterized protein n=1 Tax=Tachysurus vachellii TaxID=175792 RepID=A0AA88M6V9_TACVA|nr:hypothetical protein Q7C36_016571 [Tachysurus vachellii]